MNEHVMTSEIGATSRGPKPRSCIVCRTRKVACDKLSPCSNCRKANIECVVASKDRKPRWARKFQPSPDETHAPADMNVTKLQRHVRNLEKTVHDLKRQLRDHQDNAKTIEPDVAIPELDPSQLGRLVLHDDRDSRYVSTEFWTHMDDRLSDLKSDAVVSEYNELDSSDDEHDWNMSTPATSASTPVGTRNAFLLMQYIDTNTLDLRDFHPLPSQIPFLLDIFAENVNPISQITHMPSIRSLTRRLRGGDLTKLTSADEALLLSIYFAAIVSMDEDDAMANFGIAKPELLHRFRSGFELALAKADCLESPSVPLVQALGVYLAVARCHGSPKHIWMMTGLVIRMARYLGLHKDGSSFATLSPFEVESRRRIWWHVMQLDLRASEDQATESGIPNGSFDAQIPLNINDADLQPDMKAVPVSREGITDTSFTRIMASTCRTTRELMYSGALSRGLRAQDKDRLLDTIYRDYQDAYLDHTTQTTDVKYWFAMTVSRVVRAKLMLLVFLPDMFVSKSETLSVELSDRLLVAAIELAELNDTLHEERAWQPWHWVCRTYSHWHAIIYILLEACRRPWIATIERAWRALHSKWLIPRPNSSNQYSTTWVPFRKLMTKARKHRKLEVEKMRNYPQYVLELESQDCSPLLLSQSGGPVTDLSAAVSRESWRRLANDPVVGTEQCHLADFSFNEVLRESSQIISEARGSSTDPTTDCSWSVGALPIHSMADQTIRVSTEPCSSWSGNAFDFPVDFSLDYPSGATEIDLDFGNTMNWQNWIDLAPTI